MTRVGRPGRHARSAAARPPPLGTGPYRIAPWTTTAAHARAQPHFRSGRRRPTDRLRRRDRRPPTPPGRSSTASTRSSAARATSRRSTTAAAPDAAQRSGIVDALPRPRRRCAGAGHGLHVPQRPRAAVRRRARPPRRQLRHRPRADGRAVREARRPRSRPARSCRPASPGARPTARTPRRPRRPARGRARPRRARRLIAASGTRGMRVRVWTDTSKVRFGRYFARPAATPGVS